MQFLHISDTHLGNRRYNLESRENDIYNTFNELIDTAIKDHVNAVVHTGDLFDEYKPSNTAMLQCIRGLKKLKEKNIPFIAIPGDHDTPKKKGEIYAHKILSESLELMHLITGDETKFYEINYNNTSIKFYGIKHIPTVAKQKLLDTLSSLKPDGKKNVLMLHQGLRDKLPYDGAWQIEEGNLPNGFNYYAFGHFHTRFIENMSNGVLAIAGSPDIIREEEIDGYNKLGKGAFLVDLSGDQPNIGKINLKIRPQEVVHINTSKIDIDIENIIKKYEQYELKPILHVVLEGEKIDRTKLYQKISLLNKIAEYYRIFKDNTEEGEKTKIKVPTGSTIIQIISNYLLSKGYSNYEINLIMEMINNYNSDEIENMIKRFGDIDEN
jgi:exonuclease SbcD